MSVDTKGTEVRPAEDLITRHLGDRVCFSRQHRLVNFQVLGADDAAVHHHLVAGTDADDVVQHHFVAGELDGHAVAHHQGVGLPDDGEVVQGAFGAELLDDADDGVGDDQHPEDALLHLAGGHHDDEEDEQDGVDAGEHVVPDDPGGGAAGTIRHRVDLARVDPLLDLRGAQPMDGLNGHAAHSVRPTGPVRCGPPRSWGWCGAPPRRARRRR